MYPIFVLKKDELKTSINIKAVENYAKELTQVILDDIFSIKSELISENLKSMTRIEQINMFVIQSLFWDWKKEEEKNINPYFNHHHPEVIVAKKKYLNVLSAHISLTKEETQPLLEKAIIDCIFLLLFPYDYYKKLLEQIQEEKNKILLKDLNPHLKYIRINTELKDKLHTLLEKYDNRNSFKLPIELLNEACEKLIEPPDSIEPVFEKFQSLVHISVDDLIDRVTDTDDDLKDNLDVDTTETAREDTITATDLPLFASSEKTKENSNEDREVTLVENLKNKKQVTRHEVFESENFQDDLHSKISINQRFMFLQELFDSNAIEYDEVINKIDQMKDINEVQNYLSENIVNKFNWDFESDEVIEFMNLIRLKFS